MPSPESLTADLIASRVARWRPLPRSLYDLLALRHDSPSAEPRLLDILASDLDLDRRMQVLGRVSPDVRDEGRSAAAAAIRQIGYRRIHSAAVAVLVVDALAADAREFDFLDYWRHAAACAALAATIAEAERSEARDLAYAAGLLHRVGLLGLDMVAPSSLAALHDAILDEGWSEALEEAVLGFTVRDVTAALHVRWRLPLELSEAHLVLNEPSLWSTRPLAHILSVASDSLGPVGIPDPLRGVSTARSLAPEAQHALERYFQGPENLLRRAEGLIGACLLAREEDASPARQGREA